MGVVFTRRAAGLRAHGGEICLPGGRLEPGESATDAAVREAAEELDVAADQVDVVGTLDQTWTGASSVVTPVVAWYRGDMRCLAPASPEVDEVLIARVSTLLDPANHAVKAVELHGRTYHDDVLRADGFIIYGPTADIALDLIAWLTNTERGRVQARAENLIHFVTHVVPARDVAE